MHSMHERSCVCWSHCYTTPICPRSPPTQVPARVLARLWYDLWSVPKRVTPLELRVTPLTALGERVQVVMVVQHNLCRHCTSLHAPAPPPLPLPVNPRTCNTGVTVTPRID